MSSPATVTLSASRRAGRATGSRTAATTATRTTVLKVSSSSRKTRSKRSGQLTTHWYIGFVSSCSHYGLKLNYRLQILVFINFSAQDASKGVKKLDYFEPSYGNLKKINDYKNQNIVFCLLMMGTEIFKMDASLAEKLMKTKISILMTPTVFCI